MLLGTDHLSRGIFKKNIVGETQKKNCYRRGLFIPTSLLIIFNFLIFRNLQKLRKQQTSLNQNDVWKHEWS